MKFLTYNPEQAYLLPPSVHDVLGEDAPSDSLCTERWSGWIGVRSSKGTSSKAARPIIGRCG